MTKTIKLTRGQVALVDDEDFDYLSQWNWSARKDVRTGKWYAQRPVGTWPRRQLIHMHRLIMGASDPMIEVDHKDGNSLNNTRCNLRACTKAQNQHNRQLNRNSTSGFKGVHWHKRIGKYEARIQVDGKRIALGYYSDPKEAARVYDEAAIKYFGEFAQLNLQ